MRLDQDGNGIGADGGFVHIEHIAQGRAAHTYTQLYSPLSSSRTRVG
jgi:hypothetical protein